MFHRAISWWNLRAAKVPQGERGELLQCNVSATGAACCCSPRPAATVANLTLWPGATYGEQHWRPAAKGFLKVTLESTFSCWSFSCSSLDSSTRWCKRSAAFKGFISVWRAKASNSNGSVSLFDFLLNSHRQFETNLFKRRIHPNRIILDSSLNFALLSLEPKL